MDEFGDTNQKLNNIINELNNQVQTSSSRIKNLSQLTEGLVPKDEYEDLLNGATDSVTDISLERRLENKRLNLIMNIQKQEYLKTKLTELINHNSEMMLSVKEYLENKPTMITDDYKQINERVAHFNELTKSKIEGLEINNYEMAKNMKAIESLVDNIDIVDVDERKVKEATITLNGFLKEYYQ